MLIINMVEAGGIEPERTIENKNLIDLIIPCSPPGIWFLAMLAQFGSLARNPSADGLEVSNFNQVP